MQSKKLLFIGIALLILGIVFRKFTDMTGLGLLMILIGVGCKTIYIIAKTKSGEYKPGKELIWLFLGLALFLTGLVLKSNNPGILPTVLIVSGLSLKLLFILIFIKKVKPIKRCSINLSQACCNGFFYPFNLIYFLNVVNCWPWLELRQNNFNHP